MEDEKILTVEELDELLAKEFAKDDSEDQEDIVDEVEEEESVDEESEQEEVDPESEEEQETEDTEDSEVDDEEEPKVVETKKGKTPEEKKDYAFAKLRKEASEAKKLADERAKQVEEHDNILRTLMEQSGFSDLESFKKALNKQVDEKKRQESGYSEDEYKKIKLMEQREAEIKQREEQLKKQEFDAKARRFDSTVRDIIQSQGMSEADRLTVYTELENLGYTADILLSLPNPQHLIKGVVSEIKGNTVPVKRKTVDTGRIVTTPNKQSFESQQDELLKKELKDYERSKYGQ